tara:strand:+ start:2399 stop:2632 length:234 start_codon:yes stop_codon:yes gene_type:complete
MDNQRCIKEKNNCNCLSINYEDKKRYIDFCVDKFNISEEIEHTLYLSTKKQLRSFIKHYYNFDINCINNDYNSLINQ